MKRSEFLKMLGIGTAAAIVAPKLLIPEEKKWTQKMSIQRDHKPITGERVDHLRKYPLTEKEAYPSKSWIHPEERKRMEKYQKEVLDPMQLEFLLGKKV